MKKTLLILLCALVGLPAWSQKNYSVFSPGKKTEVKVMIGDQLRLSILQGGVSVVESSELGLTLQGVGTLGDSPKVIQVKESQVDQKIKSPFYRKSEIRDRYNELQLFFTENYKLIVRSYDNGAAYRFETTLPKDVIVEQERFEVRFASSARGYAAYTDTPFETLDQQYVNPFENTYDYKPMVELNSQRLIFLPILVELPDAGKKVCITETDVYDYPGLFVTSCSDRSALIGRQAQVPVMQPSEKDLKPGPIFKRETYIAKTSGTRTYPWRIFAIASEDKELLDNDLVYQLSTSSQVADTKWIRPGQVAWDWWNDWNVTGVDFRAGINNATYKYYIDFASKNGLEYIIMDAGWTVDGSEDLLKVIPEINLKELISYGASKDVGIILWADWKGLRHNTESVMKHYATLGIKGFKVDYMDRDDQPMNRFLWHVARLGAENKLLIDFHGAPKPFGMQRTYPNVINQEGVSGMEQMKWQKPGYDQVTYDLTFPFIRMVAGYVDYTQGAMRNAIQAHYFPSNSEPMSQGTRCRQLADYVIFDSPLNMLSDSPTDYMREQECTDFITAIPTVWENSVALESQVGSYIAMARQNGADWYVGAINDWSTREMKLDLSFLTEGTYKVELFRDGVNADRRATDYKKEILTIQIKGASDKILPIKMYPGGGFAARLTLQ